MHMMAYRSDKPADSILPDMLPIIIPTPGSPAPAIATATMHTVRLADGDMSGNAPQQQHTTHAFGQRYVQSSHQPVLLVLPHSSYSPERSQRGGMVMAQHGVAYMRVRHAPFGFGPSGGFHPSAAGTYSGGTYLGGPYPNSMHGPKTRSKYPHTGSTYSGARTQRALTPVTKAHMATQERTRKELVLANGLNAPTASRTQQPASARTSQPGKGPRLMADSKERQRCEHHSLIAQYYAEQKEEMRTLMQRQAQPSSSWSSLGGPLRKDSGRGALPTMSVCVSNDSIQ
jgi:hypothetical protein